jgi:hypothetical protein
VARFTHEVPQVVLEQMHVPVEAWQVLPLVQVCAAGFAQAPLLHVPAAWEVFPVQEAVPHAELG